MPLSGFSGVEWQVVEPEPRNEEVALQTNVATAAALIQPPAQAQFTSSVQQVIQLVELEAR